MNDETARTGKLTAIIVDDEPHAREALETALKKHEEVEIIATCVNGLEAVKAVNELQPQLMFLDVQMPKLDGFDVLELLGPATPMVVFVTAFDEYAVKAFEANAVDYLLKPLDPERLDQTLSKVQGKLTGNRDEGLERIVNDPQRQEESPRRILVRDGSDVHVIPVDDVLYMESADDYVAIHTADATHIKLDRLNKLEQRLNPRQFCRIHRSYLLNINCLAKIEQETKDSRIAILTSGKELPISRSGYSVLKTLL